MWKVKPTLPYKSTGIHLSSTMLANMDSVADRIRWLRSHLKLTQEQFGRAAGGVSKQAVYQWEKGPNVPERDSILALRKNRNINPDWLLRKDGEPFLRGTPNVVSGPDVKGRVPIISSTQAGDWREIVDNYQPGEAEEWANTTVPIRAHTYALRVQGDSMEPEFPSGAIIIVEPELLPEPGDYVVVKLNGDSTFKQLIRDGAELFLKPINDRYPIRPLPEDAEFCGVVRELVRRFR